MKLLIVSDSHGEEKLLKELLAQYPNMDYYLHAGDSGLDISSLYPYISVKGNTDYYPFDEKIKIYTPMGYLLIKHKPIFTLEELKDNKFLVHGHTHQYRISIELDNIFLNPGSISLPRDDSNGSYMIMEINQDKSSIIIYDIETKNVLLEKQIVYNTQGK